MVQMKFNINILTKCFSLTIWISYLSGLMISFHVSAVLYRFITHYYNANNSTET